VSIPLLGYTIQNAVRSTVFALLMGFGYNEPTLISLRLCKFNYS